MRVLFMGTDGNKSGASLSMIGVAKEARKMGIDVYIIIPSHGMLENELNKENIPYTVIRTFNWIQKSKQQYSLVDKLKRIMKCQWNNIAEKKIAKCMKEINPDIVHLNTICSGAGAKSAIIQNRKLIWHIREFVEEDHGYEFWNKKQAYPIVAKSNYIITISKSVYNKFHPIFQSTPMQMIYNGVDINKFLNNKVQLFSSLSIIRIYMCGSIAYSKGQHELLDAAILLKKQSKFDFEIHFVGKGSEVYIRGLKEKVKSNHLESNIYFDGFKDNIQNEWAKADIAVVASRAEAFGRVTLEAMLAGALVIGANTAGTAELITNQETGLLYEQGNISDLAEKISYAVMNSEKMKEIAKKGQKYARENFSAEKNADAIIDCYKQADTTNRFGKKYEY